MRVVLSLRIILVGIAAWFSALTQAAVNPVDLQALRDHSFKAATQLIMYVALDKAQERYLSAEQSIAKADSLVSSLNDAALSKRWQQTRASLKTNPFVENEADQRIIYTWENEVMALAADIERRQPRDMPRLQKDLHDLTARMQVMLIIYLRNSADPFGGNNYTGINADKDLSKMAAEFTPKLNELILRNPAIKASLPKIQAKWLFLSQRISDYKSKNVPFIVDLYGRQIIDMLLAASKAP